MSIGKEEVKEIISRLPNFVKAEFTDEEIQQVVDEYEGEASQDPTGTWDLIIETQLYQVLENRQYEKIQRRTQGNIHTADEVINMIADTLREADGKFIEQIANQVLTAKTKYNQDSFFELNSPD